ncbi:hypothetical protein OIU79_018670 [Salix purpurea]|uniref:Uncharacterized protein n=1 Tax=Salix purpurea TaxID=77065 RepID=A0A9Q1AL82_SALPP|nr:hypothetical protein OIU79_018670 [Salix purpurea]
MSSYCSQEDLGSDGDRTSKRKKPRKELVDLSADSKKEMTVTTRQRALQTGKDVSSDFASLIEFPYGLPPAPPKRKTSAADSSRSGSGQYDYSRNFGAINHLSSSFTTDEVSVDATSEKELGNEYFKQKKFNEAIECYSRSIALSPTAVTHANRAMAYLKIKSLSCQILLDW